MDYLGGGKGLLPPPSKIIGGGLASALPTAIGTDVARAGDFSIYHCDHLNGRDCKILANISNESIHQYPFSVL